MNSFSSTYIDRIEKNIQELLSEIPIADQLRSIKGLGSICTAAILSGAGDLKQYAHGRQLLRKAGLNLAESMSENNVQVKHMKKQQSIFKLLGKLARIIISIVHKGETFSHEIAAPVFMQAA
ncbi:transposase [Paenibacillus sp. WQ 127069]|uniref:Transposase n=1 Tax=Paenibacillus baimaensis TaxID=2982185 RepID=A0ABT2UJQ1_9BACL|nr:transposase [Paenibacillus sp. WQ 127069]MCU6794865.1 transposase [Paenibacillus sp. WQ 127069]